MYRGYRVREMGEASPPPQYVFPRGGGCCEFRSVDMLFMRKKKKDESGRV
jgi:hypothetical protein